MYEQFAANGYSAAMPDAAASVRIQTPAVASDFGSQDDIMLETLEQEINRFFKRLQKQIRDVEQQSFEPGLEAVFTFVLNYFHEQQRLRFWRNIPLIQNEALLQQCRSKINSYEKELGEELFLVFQKAAAQGEIKADNLEGRKAMFVAMVHGLLDGMLLYHDCSIDIMVSAVKAWDAYWDGIKQ